MVTLPLNGILLCQGYIGSGISASLKYFKNNIY